MIEISNACKRYADKSVLDNVSLHIPTGGITSIVGPNGAGKSTLLSAIGRLLTLDGGSIQVNGMDVVHTPSSILARHLSILRQENQFSARLTVRELVSFGRYPYSHGRLTVEDVRHVDEALAFTDMQDLAHRFLDELSGGQKQRACVAMVLCQDTEYVLLDEPLNNLDMRHSVQMMGQIRRAADELGKTVVLVVHDINFAAAYSDQVVAMQQGLVVYDGPVDTLMDEQLLLEIFETPVQVAELGGRKLGVYYRPD